MIELSRQLYQQLQEELYLKQQAADCCRTVIESCFQTCLDYWELLKEQIREKGFESSATEIQFFKTVKPLFLAEIEFYHLLIMANLFEPDATNLYAVLNFWCMQIGRLEKLKTNEKEFYAYLQKEGTSQDLQRFTRTQFSIGIDSNPYTLHSYFDQDEAYCAEWDGLIGKMMALQRFESFANGQIRYLNAIANDSPVK